MERTPEPELMDGPEQALAYAQADFEEPNRLFVDQFRQTFGAPDGPVLDLGCGPGDITLRLADAFPGVVVHGIDGAPRMLDLARHALGQRPDLRERVTFVEGVIAALRPPRSDYSALVCNSLLHHLHDPMQLWHAIRAHGSPGAAVLVMDLCRPESDAEARRIVDCYGAGEPVVLRRDFHASLHAAFTPGEVRAQLDAAGLPHFRVEQPSDRHLVVAGRLPRG